MPDEGERRLNFKPFTEEERQKISQLWREADLRELQEKNDLLFREAEQAAANNPPEEHMGFFRRLIRKIFGEPHEIVR